MLPNYMTIHSNMPSEQRTAILINNLGVLSTQISRDPPQSQKLYVKVMFATLYGSCVIMSLVGGAVACATDPEHTDGIVWMVVGGLFACPGLFYLFKKNCN